MQVNLPLAGNISELPEGCQWLDAVQKAKEFERSYPNWFDSRFGTPTDIVSPTPLFVTQESGFYSGDGSVRSAGSGRGLYRHLSSVSNTAEMAISGEEDEFADHYDRIRKDDFIEPSNVLSAYTILPRFIAGEMPEEIDDAASTLSEQMRRQNERYEQDRFEEMQSNESKRQHY